MALLVLWILVLALGFAVQFYREDNSPPFYPPNIQYWRATKNAGIFLYQSTFKCCYRITTCSRWQEPPNGEYQRAPSEVGTCGGDREMISNNGPLPAEGISVADEFLDTATENLTARVNEAFASLKTFVTSGFGFRRGTNASSYQSFPRYPGEEEVEEPSEEVSGDANGDLSSVRVDVRTPPPSFKKRITSAFSSVREKVTQKNIFKRRTRIDQEDADASSASSDDEVDRRADGIFGEPEDCLRSPSEEVNPSNNLNPTASLVSENSRIFLAGDDSDEGLYEDAGEERYGDLADESREDNFTHSKLVLE